METSPARGSVITKDDVNNLIMGAQSVHEVIPLQRASIRNYVAHGVTCEYPLVSLRHSSPLRDWRRWNYVTDQDEFNTRLFIHPAMAPLHGFDLMAHGIVIAGINIAGSVIGVRLVGETIIDDVELYLVGHTSDHDRYNAISALGDHLAMHGSITVSRTSKVVTFAGTGHSSWVYRVSLCAYSCIDELLHSLSVGPWAVAFDGATTWLTKSSVFSFNYSCFPLCLSTRCSDYENNLVKYLNYGFSIIMPHLNVEKASWLKYIEFEYLSSPSEQLFAKDVCVRKTDGYTSIFEDDIISPPPSSYTYEPGMDLSTVGINYGWYSDRIAEAASLIPRTEINVFFSDDGKDALTMVIGRLAEDYVRSQLGGFMSAAVERIESVKEIGPGLIPYVFTNPRDVMSCAISEAEWYGDAYLPDP